MASVELVLEMNMPNRSAAEVAAVCPPEELLPASSQDLAGLGQDLRAAIAKVSGEPEVRELYHWSTTSEGWTHAFDALDRLDESLKDRISQLAAEAKHRTLVGGELFLVPAETLNELSRHILERVWEISSDIESARHGTLYPGATRWRFLTLLDELKKDVDDSTRRLRAKAKARILGEEAIGAASA
ncbi:hypothetical protein F4X86_00525 [Candidatus Saccharibacteria bacterium]|nr:hypothetical protein [Candidatus Saccharibacteria bacterium]